MEFSVDSLQLFKELLGQVAVCPLEEAAENKFNRCLKANQEIDVALLGLVQNDEE